MSTFLRAVSPAPPAGWIGDGVTPATVTGSPIGYNKVRLEGPDPNLDGKNHNFVETTLFVVSGHIPAELRFPCRSVWIGSPARISARRSTSTCSSLPSRA